MGSLCLLEPKKISCREDYWRVGREPVGKMVTLSLEVALTWANGISIYWLQVQRSWQQSQKSILTRLNILKNNL
jgi:hypothetical protein